MQSVTLTVAIVGSILMLSLRPARAFVAYIAAICFYPGYLVINIGTLDISVGRILIGVLLLRCLCDRCIRSKFVWSQLDTWVTCSIAVYVGVVLLTQPLSQALENRSGFLMDTWLPYMTARFIITDRRTMVTFVKGVGIVLVPLALLGIIETCTGWQPYIRLTRYCPWRPEILSFNPRSGFYRATGPFFHPIMFGMLFATFLPLVYALRHERSYWHNLAYFLAGAATIGALSSMSSGPWVMVLAVIFCLTMERFKRWVKPMFIGFVLGCVLIEFAANPPFYYVLASLSNPVGGSWWHRARLIDAAIAHFGEWWLAGYGGEDPGWGEFLGGLAETDVTNHFILTGVNYGIWGVIALTSVLTVATRKLVLLHNSTKDAVATSWAWAMGSTLVALIVAFMSVSLFGQMGQIFYCILGIVGSSSILVAAPATTKRPQALYEAI